MHATLTLWLLGPWRGQLDRQPLPSFPTRHTRALLARLALAHPQPVSRQVLQGDLFPHATAESAARRLRTTLYYLRRTLGDHLLSDRDVIALGPTLIVHHDVGRFESGTLPAASLADLQMAVDLYRGPFLGGVNDGWAEQEARRLHHLYLDAVHRLVTLAQTSNDFSLALNVAQRWVDEEPWEEEAHLALVRALCAKEEYNAAAAQLSRARTLLRTEWGSTSAEMPGDAFKALEREVGRLVQSVRGKTASDRARAGTRPPNPPLDFDNLPLIGREQELAHLSRVWQQVQQGRGQRIIVEGAAGVGKTRLVDELIARVRLRADTLVLRTIAREHMPNQALGLLRSAFGHLSDSERDILRVVCVELDDVIWGILGVCLPELAQLLPDRPLPVIPRLEGMAETVRRQHALLWFIESLTRQRALLLVVEDAHYADEETLSLVEELSWGTRSLLTLLVCRPSSAISKHESIPGDNILSVAPLSEPATKELICRALSGEIVPALLERLVMRSGGNPLFAREILRALKGLGALICQRGGWRLKRDDIGLPNPVTDLLARRLAPLSADARELAQLLAVLNRPADDALLECLWPDEATRMAAQAELLEQWVVREQGDWLLFDHVWLGETLSASLDVGARPPLHARVVKALCAQQVTDPAECMVHYTGAGQWCSALTAAVKAAEQALNEGHLPAVQLALNVAQQAAASLALAPHDPQYWPLLRLRERYHALSERGPNWQDDFIAMEALARANQRADWMAESLNRRGRALREQGNVVQAEAVLRRAAHIAHQAVLPVIETEARINLVYAMADRGVVDQALIEGQTAVQASQRSKDEILHIRALGTLAYAQMRAGCLERADKLQMELIRRPAVQKDALLLSRLMRHLSITKMARREYEAGFEWGRQSIQKAQAVGDLYAVSICQGYLLHELMNFGLYTEARQLVGPTLALARRLNVKVLLFWALYHSAELSWQDGETVQALAMAQEAAQLGETLDLADEIAAGQALIARIAMSAGNLPLALEAVRKAERLLVDKPTSEWPIGHVLAQVWWAAGAYERAYKLAQETVTQAQAALPGKYLSVIAVIEALWEAAAVLEKVEGKRAVAGIRQQAAERFVDDVTRLKSISVRQAFIMKNGAHQSLAEFARNGSYRLVSLPLRAAPTGRPLHADELVPVVWTLYTPDDPPLSLPHGRRRRLERLCTEAVDQGAVATVDALAEVLAVSSRTLLRDLKELRLAGVRVETRGHPG